MIILLLPLFPLLQNTKNIDVTCTTTSVTKEDLKKMLYMFLLEICSLKAR